MGTNHWRTRQQFHRTVRQCASAVQQRAVADKQPGRGVQQRTGAVQQCADAVQQGASTGQQRAGAVHQRALMGPQTRRTVQQSRATGNSAAEAERRRTRVVSGANQSVDQRKPKAERSRGATECNAIAAKQSCRSIEQPGRPFVQPRRTGDQRGSSSTQRPRADGASLPAWSTAEFRGGD